MHLNASIGVGAGFENADGDEELPWEPEGHGAIATGSITKCKEFWRTFVRSPVVMKCIEERGLPPIVDDFPTSAAGV